MYENELLFTGAIDGDEAHELRAIRVAGKYFEQNTILKDDKGGWWGNMKPLQKVSAWCGEEAETHLRFLERLAEGGLLKHFSPIPGILVRPEWLGFNNHSAVVLRSKKTGKLFVYDSWFENGGRSARVLTMDDWLDKKDEQNAVGLPPGHKD